MVGVHFVFKAYRYERQRARNERPAGQFRISTEQVAHLNALGFDWGNYDKVQSGQWDKMFVGKQNQYWCTFLASCFEAIRSQTHVTSLCYCICLLGTPC